MYIYISLLANKLMEKMPDLILLKNTVNHL